MRDFLYRLLMTMADATEAEWHAYYATHQKAPEEPDTPYRPHSPKRGS